MDVKSQPQPQNINDQLIEACQTGNVGNALNLIRAGADVNYKNINGQCPLYFASVNGRAEVVDMLIKSGAVVDIRDKFDRTPLFAATFHKKNAVVKMLIDRGADVNVPDKSGKTPLFWASKFGNTELMILLLSRGAQIDFYTEDLDPEPRSILENWNKFPDGNTPFGGGKKRNKKSKKNKRKSRKSKKNKRKTFKRK